MTDSNGKSIGTLIKELTENLSTLVRSEIALAKLELREAAVNAGAGVGLLVSAVFCALLALAFLFVTIVLALALVMPAWLAALIVAVVLLGLAVALGIVGKNKFKQTQLIPAGAIESVKSDIQAIKAEFSRARGR